MNGAASIDIQRAEAFGTRQIQAPSLTLKTSSYTAVKTHALAEKILKAIAAVFLMIPILGWTVAFILNRIDKNRTKELRGEVDASRWKSIQRVAKTFSEVHFTGGEDPCFDKKFNRLKTHLFSCPVNHGDVQRQSIKVQRAIAKLFSEPQYQKLTGTEDQRIRLIGQLALSIRTDARGGAAFQKWGRRQTGPFLAKECDKGQFSFKDLGDLLAKAFNASRSTTMDFIPDVLFWGLVHPLSMFEAIKGLGVLGFDPVKDFNPYLKGNVNIAGWDYKLEGMTGASAVRFAFGPGPGISSDRLLEAGLDFLQTDGGIHLQHSLEHPKEMGEIKRMERLKEIESRYPGKFRLLMTPLNGSAWRMEEEFLQWESPSEFIKLYKNYACTGKTSCPVEDADSKAYRSITGDDKSFENGFYVGKDAMTDGQFEGAFDCAANIFDTELSSENPYIQEMKANGDRGKALLGKGMQVFTQALIAMGALTKLMGEDSKCDKQNPMFFGQACREDIDRGVVVNVATKLLFYLYQGKEITREDVDQIVGETLGRAELVLKRRILIDKFEGLVSFLHLIGSHPDGQIKQRIQLYLENSFPGLGPIALSCEQVSAA